MDSQSLKQNKFVRCLGNQTNSQQKSQNIYFETIIQIFVDKLKHMQLCKYICNGQEAYKKDWQVLTYNNTRSLNYLLGIAFGSHSCFIKTFTLADFLLVHRTRVDKKDNVMLYITCDNIRVRYNSQAQRNAYFLFIHAQSIFIIIQ